VADDVLRDFEGRWWGAARKGDTDTLADMLAGGREVLATTVDDNGRTCVLWPSSAASVSWTYVFSDSSHAQGVALRLRRRL
jgi:signal recognition particle protein